jgi:3'-phosphoadenosine 5'-phosphosulfate sulfotransferase (PAPS reductase)/FAD synthetase
MSERSRRAKSRGTAGQAGLFPAFRLDDPEADARAILDGAVELHRPSAIVGLFSGGHDSLCACHVASRHPLFAGCAHVNTGIGIERTRQFVRDTCRQFGWPLRELHPPPFVPALEKRKPWIDYANLPAYEALVLHHGFPGPSGHRLMYNRLKERCLRRLVKERKHHAGDRVLFVSGVRRDESTRRMGINQAVQREGCRVWAAPLLNWDGIHKRDYMGKHRLPRNEVVEALCMSGECCCGSFAKPHELDEIARVAPRDGCVHSLPGTQGDGSPARRDASGGRNRRPCRGRRQRTRGPACSPCAGPVVPGLVSRSVRSHEHTVFTSRVRGRKGARPHG